MAKARLFPSRPQGRAVFPSIDAVVARTRPSDPLLCLRPAAIAGAARRFTELFPGDVLYAVKASRFLTHMKKLKDPAEPIHRLFQRAQRLQRTFGPVLYQLPPHDVPRS